MKRTIEVEAEYKLTAKKAIAKFFKKYPELDYWKELLEYMAENNEEHYCDDKYADGTKNTEWTYSIWLDQNGEYTYIAIIERQ